MPASHELLVRIVRTRLDKKILRREELNIAERCSAAVCFSVEFPA